jgi:hypothetical protein
MGAQITSEDFAKIPFGGSGRRAVVVGEVDVRDAEVERAKHDVALYRAVSVVAEIVPET